MISVIDKFDEIGIHPKDLSGSIASTTNAVPACVAVAELTPAVARFEALLALNADGLDAKFASMKRPASWL